MHNLHYCPPASSFQARDWWLNLVVHVLDFHDCHALLPASTSRNHRGLPTSSKHKREHHVHYVHHRAASSSLQARDRWLNLVHVLDLHHHHSLLPAPAASNH